MDPLASAAIRIIKEQQSIIGPMALDQAKKVEGLQVVSIDDIKITGNGKEVLDNLVKQYAKFFGQASIEVCKEAVAPLISTIPTGDLPDSLKN